MMKSTAKRARTRSLLKHPFVFLWFGLVLLFLWKQNQLSSISTTNEEKDPQGRLLRRLTKFALPAEELARFNYARDYYTGRDKKELQELEEASDISSRD